ncbi:MAG: serine/threonine protein kinase, partial [Myxococcales bacterium]|nr:serine/threonine protein kinase [Myxococcales bacterium]
MSHGSTLEALFERGRPAPHGLEVEQVVGALAERFGARARPPVTIGRYQVAGRLGAGGLGIVYRAFDPSLARFVAIKVLKGGKEAAEHDARLLREAQVLARIRHPHVVEVFDVGFFEDHGRRRFFVAMELVEGTDLRVWLARGQPLRATCDAFLAAAQGLRAAHEAGLLHRDFKPSNVLLGNQGRVLVTDFGLARAHDGDDPDHEPPARRSSGSVRELDAITEVGEVVGTPAYMAPEQLRGDPVDARADQYAYCTALYEGLYGARPFLGDDVKELRQAIWCGPPPEPRDRAVPAWLRRIVLRGLSVDPAERFPDMDALLAALERDPSRRRRRIA